MEQVSWDDVQQFIQKLNVKTGRNYRLPTEAEWEYAARGGNKPLGKNYSILLNLDEIAWYYRNSKNTTHSAGNKEPNELGLYDMIGNVNEWCFDNYESYDIDSQINPKSISTNNSRVYRGGSWNDTQKICRFTFRDRSARGYSDSHIGFRLALSIK